MNAKLKQRIDFHSIETNELLFLRNAILNLKNLRKANNKYNKY
jgi:hypothetical protein